MSLSENSLVVNLLFPFDDKTGNSRYGVFSVLSVHC